MDVSQYLEIFIDESEEHLQTLSDCIMVLEKEPDNKDTINEVFRAAHSLKGMAGTMGFKRMQHLTTEYAEDKVTVLPVTTAEYGISKAARPFNSRLDKKKLVENGFTPLPTWQDALSRYLKEIEF